MASLDDFFAKKNKKKNKGKQYTTAEELAKKLEEPVSKKIEKPNKKDRTLQDNDENNPLGNDEWKDFEEEKKDYSGLKIGRLTLNSDNGNTSGPESVTGDSNADDDSNRDGSNNQSDSSNKGPWKKISVPEKQAAQEEATQETLENVEKEPSKYIPPSRRVKSQPTKTTSSRLKSRTAPDINNEEFFPTLNTKTNK